MFGGVLNPASDFLAVTHQRLDSLGSVMGNVIVKLHNARFEQEDGGRATKFKVAFFLPAPTGAAVALVLHHASHTSSPNVYVNDIPEIACVQYAVFTLVFAEYRQLPPNRQRVNAAIKAPDDRD